MPRELPNVQMFTSRPAWLAARSADPTTIGASEAAVALGISPHARPWDLWERRRGGQQTAANELLHRGNRWEGAVLAEYEDASGHQVIRPGSHFGRPGALTILAHPTHPWLRESPDAFAVEGRELGHVEAKTAMHAREWSLDPGVVIDRWSDDCARLVPPPYAVQAYVQLEVSGLPWNDLCALVPANGWLAVRWVRILRDEETQGQILEQLAEWRDRHLVQGIPPDIDESSACSRYMAARFPRVEKLSRPATSDEVALMQRLAEARAKKDEYETIAKEASNRLIELAAGARLVVQGFAKDSPYGQIQACGGGTAIDAELLRREHPEIAAACTVQRAASATFRVYRIEKG